MVFSPPNASFPPGVLQTLIAHCSLQQASCKSNCHLGPSGIFRFAAPRLRVASVTCSFAKRQLIQVPLEILFFLGGFFLVGFCQKLVSLIEQDRILKTGKVACYC